MPKRKHQKAEIGETYGNWTVAGVSFFHEKRMWVLCRCACGAERLVREDSLLSGGTSSCGCIGNITHGATSRLHQQRSSEYTTWCQMRSRCNRKSNRSYGNYGGRGIAVCDRWNESFSAFLEDMGKKPTPRHSIERIDNDGNYEPSNCVWADHTTQVRNRRNTLLVNFRGKEVCLGEVGEKLGIGYRTLWARIFAHGWSVERALTEPLRASRKSA